MINPRWDWVFQDEEGEPTQAALSPAFTTRYDAEEWLGGAWRTLASRGIAVALLRHDGERTDRVNLVGAGAGQARESDQLEGGQDG